MERKCFISAPLGLDLSVLRSLLEQYNYSFTTPEDIRSGELWHDVLRKCIESSDLTIFVLQSRVKLENVCFELGFAVAMSKPVLLIASPELGNLPSDLASLFNVRADIDNAEAIGFALQQMNVAPNVSNRKVHGKRKSLPLGKLADVYLNNLRSLRSEREINVFVHKLLQDAGVDAVSEPRISGHMRPDFAIWSDELHAYVGNPLIVEVKYRIHDLKKEIHKFSKSLSITGSRWGLFLYAKGLNVQTIIPELRYEPNVLALPLDDLIEKLRSKSFSEIIRNLRNQRVHGVRT